MPALLSAGKEIESTKWPAIRSSEHREHEALLRSKSATEGTIHRSSPLAWFRAMDGGAEGSRTPDLLIANETLYQLSYDPVPPMSGENISDTEWLRAQGRIRMMKPL